MCVIKKILLSPNFINHVSIAKSFLMNKKLFKEKYVVAICIALVSAFSAWLNYSWNDLDYLQWKSLDEYTFHGVLVKLHHALVTLDIRSFFAYSFYSYGFIFFLINYFAVFPFFSDPTSEFMIFIPKMVNTVFFILSLLYMNLSMKELKINNFYRFLAFVFIIAMPGIWFNVNWFHPDFMMTAFLLMAIYFLSKSHFTLNQYNDTAIVFWGIAIAIKIQAITFAPIFIWLICKRISYHGVSSSELRLLAKIALLIVSIYVLLNPYLLHLDGINAWVENLKAEFFNASYREGNPLLPLSIKLNFGIFNYYMTPLLFISVLSCSLFLTVKDINSRRFSIMGALSLTILANMVYFIFFMNKGWNHYFLPSIFLSIIIIFSFLENINFNQSSKVIFLSILFIAQLYSFSLDFEKIFANRFLGVVESKDSVFDYQPKEYSNEELIEKSNSMFSFLEKNISTNSFILSSAYIGLPLKKLNLSYGQVRVIFGSISPSDINWLSSAPQKENFILIKKEQKEKLLNNLSKKLYYPGLEIKIIDENDCCILLNAKTIN